jgi:hypothetical protein
MAFLNSSREMSPVPSSSMIANRRCRPMMPRHPRRCSAARSFASTASVARSALLRSMVDPPLLRAYPVPSSAAAARLIGAFPRARVDPVGCTQTARSMAPNSESDWNAELSS